MRELIKPAHFGGVIYKRVGNKRVPQCLKDPLAIEWNHSHLYLCVRLPFACGEKSCKAQSMRGLGYMFRWESQWDSHRQYQGEGWESSWNLQDNTTQWLTWAQEGTSRICQKQQFQLSVHWIYSRVTWNKLCCGIAIDQPSRLGHLGLQLSSLLCLLLSDLKDSVSINSQSSSSNSNDRYYNCTYLLYISNVLSTCLISQTVTLTRRGSFMHFNFR